MPGMLAGTASLITAIIAALTFMDRSKPAPPAAAIVAPQSEKPSTATPPGAIADVPADDPDRDVTSCQRIAGNWVWSTGGLVNIGEDGSLEWRARATDPGPAVVGRWVCTHPKQRQYLFSWSHGFTDVFVLSADGRRVNGTNQQTSTPLFGNRQN
jgi:hypothetical protein